MKAKVKGGYDHKRQILADIAPLDAPFTIFLAATQKCNFKCTYCTHGQKGKDGIHIHMTHLEDVLFEKIVAQLQELHGIKRVLFTGLGEPLANPKLPDMVRKLKDAKVAERVEIVSNGSLLTPEISDQLIDAGLDLMRISLQGLSAKKYEEIAGIKLDFHKFFENLRYFNEHKGDCGLYIKIMDACLDDPSDEQKFYDMFGDICDQMFVESIVKTQPQMIDYYNKSVNTIHTQYGETAHIRKACPLLFYLLQIDADGNVFPCSPLGLPASFSLGNVRDTTLHDMWFGEKLYNLQMQHLRGNRSTHAVCGSCENYLCFTPEEDNLDLAAKEICKRLETRSHI